MKDEDYFNEAGKEAMNALCLRDKCGAIIVLDGVVVGRGSNGPAGGDIAHRKCELDLINSPKPKSDRTCCVHAEWRVIMDAIRNQKNLNGSVLYFTRVDAEGNILKSGDPYCTVCSRLALDAGISYFALWQDAGIKLYDTQEYNELSYHFHSQI
jgi:deoxycytidylate deaminase